MSPISEETASPFPIPSKMRIENPEIIEVNSFIVKPAGSGTRKTLVESDSLSSFSLPEESSNRKVISDDDGAKGDGSGDVLDNGSGQTRRGDFVIDMDNLDDDPPTEPTQIETYLKFMYSICASPYNPVRMGGDYRNGSLLGKMWDIVHKGCFAVFASLSVIQALLHVKMYILVNLDEGGLENFTNLAFYIMNACTKIYYVYLCVQRQTKITRMNDSFRKLRRFTRENTNRQRKKSVSSHKFATRLGIITVIVSLVQTLFAKWAPKQSILQYSIRMSKHMYIWKTEAFDDKMISSLSEQYGQDLTTTNILLGVCGAMMNYCTNTHLDVAGDLMLVTAETLKEEIGILETMIKDPENSRISATLEEFLSENSLWGHYRVLKEAVDDTNDAFDSLLKYMHVDNLMRFVYFMMNVFDGEFTLFSSVRLVYTILKTLYTYRSAAEASSFNDSGRDWVRQLAMESKDKMFLDKAAFIMDELEKQPLGLGRGQFLINESFLFRFLGSVGSVFVLQAQSREGADGATE